MPAGVAEIDSPSAPDRPSSMVPSSVTVAPCTGRPVVTSLTQTAVRSLSTATQAETGVTWRNAWATRVPGISTTYHPWSSASGNRTSSTSSPSDSSRAWKRATTGSPSVGIDGSENWVQRGAARKAARDALAASREGRR